jgi:hypothetical protein
MKSPTGRPTVYTPEIAAKICERMAQGESLRSICADENMPARSTVTLWVASNREGFSAQYEIAMQARAHYWADELLDIADDGTNDWMERTDSEGNTIGWQINGEAIQRSRLRVDSRKWLLSKMLPKFADKQAIEHTSPDGSMTPQPALDTSKLSTSALKELMAAYESDQPGTE